MKALDIGPHDATQTYVLLGPGGRSVPLPVTSTFWDELASGAFAHLGPGRLVSSHAFERDWSTWEAHPAGEEVVVLLSGALAFVLEIEGETRTIELSQPGQFLLIPRDTWHTADVLQPSTAMFITAGEGTRHRARE